MTSSAVRSRSSSDREALCVSVAMPPALDPMAASSMVQAVEKALTMLVGSGQPGLIVRADQLAEIATGLLQPSSELLQDRLQRMRTLQQIFEQGTWLSSEAINSLQAAPPSNKSQPASDWKRRGRLYSVSHGGREYFASYQFDGVYQPLPVVRDVLEAFGEVADPWVLAAWFHYPNGWIVDGAGAPIAPKDCLDRRDDVIRAAQKRISSYVA